MDVDHIIAAIACFIQKYFMYKISDEFDSILLLILLFVVHTVHGVSKI